MHLTLMTPWEDECFQMPFVSLSSPDDLAVLRQMTLREVLCVDVISPLRQRGLKMRRVSGRSNAAVDAGTRAEYGGALGGEAWAGADIGKVDAVGAESGADVNRGGGKSLRARAPG